LSDKMVRPNEPRHDAHALAATHFWEYKPATASGVPFESDSIVEISISPTR